MPNWCSNYIELTHSNPQMITRAIHALKRGELLNEFIPCPRELRETVSGHTGAETREAHEQQQDENVKKFGYPTWYEWCIDNWGTKWDVSEAEPDEQTEISFTASFDTAWSPPIPAMDKLSDMGFEVVLYYYEPGMNFCGKYSSEYGDHTYEISRDEIPEDIDDLFGISEQNWDEEEEEQE